jgi:hypothetical protein
LMATWLGDTVEPVLGLCGIDLRAWRMLHAIALAKHVMLRA